MTPRDKILQEILSDENLMSTYKISREELAHIKCTGPFPNKAVEVLSTIINENDNSRSQTQIYNTIKNIFRI